MAPKEITEEERRTNQAQLEKAFSNFSIAGLSLDKVVLRVNSLPRKLGGSKPTAVPALMGFAFRDAMEEYFAPLIGNVFELRIQHRFSTDFGITTVGGTLHQVRFVGRTHSEYAYFVLADSLIPGSEGELYTVSFSQILKLTDYGRPHITP